MTERETSDGLAAREEALSKAVDGMVVAYNEGPVDEATDLEFLLALDGLCDALLALRKRRAWLLKQTLGADQ